VAETLESRTLKIRRRVLGVEHRDTLASMDDLAAAYAAERKYEAGGSAARPVAGCRTPSVGSRASRLLGALASAAFIYQREAKYALAENYAGQALAGRRDVLGSESRDTMASAVDLSLAYQSQGKFAESEPLAREALEFNRKKQPDDWQRFRAETLLGASLSGQKKYAEAEPLLLEGYEGMAARKDRIAVPDWYHLDRADDWVVQLYEACNKPLKAAGWRKRLQSNSGASRQND
jgi:eukaryotic-like serine/threonine-protein kinase